MNRLFGAKNNAPKPSLNDAIGKVGDSGHSTAGETPH
jgi:hypothetical protein